MTDNARDGAAMSERVVVVTGATGPAGTAATAALRAVGATVVAVGHSAERLSVLADRHHGLLTERIDLADFHAVGTLAARIRDRLGRVDGLIHLVGGYRGGDTFTSNTEADWRFLSTALIDTLRHTTLAFHDDLIAAPAGRVAVVSAQAAARPTAGSAGYAAAKAAAEAWMLALADSFRRSAPSPGGGAAAVTFVVKALVDDRMRVASPDRKFPGFTDVGDLAHRIVELWAVDAADLNGVRIALDGAHG
ncbi:MAG TPA: SDR family NAD(P)-dependent oxidoreductase [Nakamurella sp.]